jgi:putative ABC transport system permease protein
VIRDYPTLPVNARCYTEWKACPAFASLAVIDHGRATLTGSGEPARLSTILGSTDLFSTLGVAPALGRTFAADESAPGRPAVAMISDQLWRSRFSADPAIIGRSITLNLNPVTVIGVLPAGFRLPGLGSVSDPEVYLPRTFGADELSQIMGMFNYEVVGRLAPGVTLADAEAQINVVAARLSRLAGKDAEVRGSILPLQSAVIGDTRRGLWVLLGAIGAVLLLACLNLGILGLSRAELQSHDSAVRAALGATRRRLVTQSLSESLLLSGAGGALGCLFAWWGLGFLLHFAPADLPRVDEVGLDPSVLLFALGATLCTTLLAGVIPAWYRARSDASSVLLANAGRSVTGSGAARRLRQSLIAIEVGVSTVLLAVATLLGGSFMRVMHADAGFHAPTVLTTRLNIPPAKYREPAAIIGYYQRVITAIAALPEVVGAAVTNQLPLNGQTWIDGVHIRGDTRPPMEQPQANVRFISPDYFHTLGIPVLAGRAFRAGDLDHTVVISARLAQILWPGADAVGRTILRGDEQHPEEFTVVGVVGNVRTDADQRPVSILYLTLAAWPMNELSLAVRLDRPTAAVLPSLRRAIQGVDAEVPLQPFHTMDQVLDTAVSHRRFLLRLVAAFAGCALTLAALGIYGVVTHSVNRRTRELGIRLTIGAQPDALCRAVLRQGMKPVALGLGAGLAAALVGGRLLAGFLYETDPRDPLALSLVAAGLLATGFLACWIPSRRVTRVDPVIALRTD